MAETKKDNIIESGVCHMSCGEGFGQLLTDTARDFAWNDCKREKAVLFLVDNLHGMTPDQARAIIDGKQKVATTKDGGGVKFVADKWTPPDFEKMREEINSILRYACFKTTKPPAGGTWFSHLPQERQNTLSTMSREVNKMIEYKLWDALDLAKQLKKLASDYMIENSERIKGNIDRVRYPLGDKTPSVDPDSSSDNSLLGSLEAASMQNIATSNLPEEAKRRLLLVAKGQAEARRGLVKIKLDKEFKHDTGWVDRYGNYYGCELGQHTALSGLLVKKFYPDDEGDAQRNLEKHGWLSCSGQRWQTTDQNPTSKQLATVKAWAIKWAADNKINWNFVECSIEEIYDRCRDV